MPLVVPFKLSSPVREKIAQHYHIAESDFVQQLLDEAALDESTLSTVKHQAESLVTYVRQQPTSGYIESFLQEYALSTEEGVALMCLAESLLRVPDKATIDALIKDKLSGANWQGHLKQSPSMFVNAASWGLMLCGKLFDAQRDHGWLKILHRVFERSSEPVIRRTVFQAMKIMSKQFVMGDTITSAIKRAKTLEEKGYAYSYDMLGEAAMTDADAQFYFEAYTHAIDAIGRSAKDKGVRLGAGVSIKLSALYPRYEVQQHAKAVTYLVKQLLTLCEKACDYDIGLTVDAEEADRLDLSLDVMEQVIAAPSISQWQGLGLAVQSYQKRAFWVLDWAADQARRHQRRLMIRLIKGAYWDSEIKHAQMHGLEEYPVFTFKTFTDVSFQACAKKLLQYKEHLYPQFATHNAYSIAMVMTLVGEYRDFEFQCLHGMGQQLYHQVVSQGILCRIYAPVGSHEDLLPYLVRRLLENGANTSFVNRINDAQTPVDKLIEAPIKKAEKILQKQERCIPLPKNIFGEQRQNSAGFDVSDYHALNNLAESMQTWQSHVWLAEPQVAVPLPQLKPTPVFSPAEHQRQIGEVSLMPEHLVPDVLAAARQGYSHWHRLPVDDRATCLEALADLLQSNQDRLYALLMLEAGKVLQDVVSELREAVDFCRYYAMLARQQFTEAQHFQGYTGEANFMYHVGRGVMLCISPWNFPLAIFLGQVVACLVAGNAVVAKPAGQTPLIACEVSKLLYQAGIPRDVYQYCPGGGRSVGQALVSSEYIDGILFTGSTSTAKHIQQTLANRKGPIVPLIAETGGQNAMIVDSTALPEQVTRDVLTSGFGSVGQRCSALRVLYIQEEVFERLTTMISGAMAHLTIGLPQYLSTDIGPVIDGPAKAALQSHQADMRDNYPCLFEGKVPDELSGHFVAPSVHHIPSAAVLGEEHFGPILHVVSYARRDLDKVIEQINRSQYGLTFGLHSRVAETVDYVTTRVAVGNCYVNRNTIGAVVGLQPFGGEGLSGTGPKAGGPNYLKRLCHERTVSIDTTAAGGNASLMTQVED